MHFRLPGLQIWFDRPPIEEAVRDNAEKTERTWSYQISLRQLETIRIEAIQAQLKIQYSLNSNLRFSGLDAAVTAWVHIVPDGPQTLQWYLDQESKLETMLAFLAGTPMSSDCIETSGNELGRVVSVMPRQNNVSYCTYQMPHEFFITRPTLAVHFCDIVNKWFDAHARVEMPSQVALSVMASEQSWLNIEFLSLMQVLEGFHRGLLGGVYTPPDHYAIVEAALTDAIPPEVAEDHRTALRSRIKYGNEVSLSRRIRELLKRLSVEIRQQILGRDGTMSQRWIDTRNYYTHWDEGLRPNVFGSQELFHANLRLRHFVRALFLDLMGVSQEAILEGLSGGHRESQHLMQINSAERNRQASNASPDDLGQSS
jgi:hypothetical protein